MFTSLRGWAAASRCCWSARIALKRMSGTSLPCRVAISSWQRNWAAERTAYSNHVVETALARGTGDKVETPYRQRDLFAKRARLMNDWADYCRLQARPLNSARNR